MASRLSHALIESDKAALQRLLASDVLIFESGGVEKGFDEYAGHHMLADMAFLREIQREPLDAKIFEFGEYALVANRSRLLGAFKGRAVDLMSTETLLLKRDVNQEWKIQHIHWSSGDAH